MSVSDGVSEGVRVRWLVAGSFSAAPTGRRFRVTPDGLADALAGAKLTFKTEVDDRLGTGGKRAYEVSFNKIKSFNLLELVATTPALTALRSLAEDLGSADLARRPSTDEALARVEQHVGRGKLYEALHAVLKPDEKPAAKPAESSSSSAPAGSDNSIDAIFAAADIKPAAASASSAISSFVSAARGSSGGSGKPNTALAKSARNVIEEHLYATAGDILRSPAVSTLEGAWRGLKLISDQCTSASGMMAEVIDTTLDDAAAAIRASLSDDPMERPDVILLPDACSSTTQLRVFAELGEEINAPVVAWITPSVIGATDVASIPTQIEDDTRATPEDWTALRAEESSRWLCTTVNRFVVVAEGTGAARRVGFASPVFGIGAMLAASFRITGSFARIIGPQGALKAPGVWDIPTGRDQGTAIPTETLFALRVQGRLVSHGVLGLGSGRNSDNVTLTNAPTVRSGTDTIPLPAQILTGRVVRYCVWVRDQITPALSDEDVRAAFEQGATVVLWTTSQGASLNAQIVNDKEGRRVAVLSASVSTEHAGSPFHMAFSLPLPG